MNTFYMAQLADGESWDLQTFFENAASSSQTIGGAFLTLMGMIGVIWGATLLVKKLMSEQDRTSWIKIAALIIIGGALAFTGITMVLNFARGGQQTIDDLGNGSAGAIVAEYQGDLNGPTLDELLSTE